MIKKLPTFLYILCVVCMHCEMSAQNTRVLIEGTIKNPDSRTIKNAHIVNLTTKVGTISNTNGTFSISVKIGDWIQVSNIQFQTKKIKIKAGNFKERNLIIYLIPVTNLLEEAELKKKMKGSLSLDLLKNKKDTLPKIDEDYYNFSKMDFTTIDKSIKQVNKMKELGSSIQKTDPTRKFAPITLVSASMPDKSLIKKRAQRKRLNFKESFPYLLKKLFGEEFFFVKLKIPKEKYFHFLSYCNPLGIEQLYKEGRRLELLKVLLKESKSYLLLLEKSK